MGMDKAYKLLAIQENISNSKAKELIDKGLVRVGDKRALPIEIPSSGGVSVRRNGPR